MVATATITPAVNAIEPNKTEAGTITFSPREYLDLSQTDDLNEPNNTDKSDVGTYTFSPPEYFGRPPTDKNVTNELIIDINSTKTPFKMPVYREVVIVYFKEMPDSIDKFASDYDVNPIFVKNDIKMAAFESNPRKDPGITSEKTRKVVEKISKDPRVEQTKEDTYLFVDPKKEIKTTPDVKYLEYADQNGGDFVPDEVGVGFWRLPPSLDEFGAKYGGKPIDVTETDLRLQSVVFQTEDQKGFIDRASKDPYVSFIQLNPYYRAASVPDDEYWNPSSPNYTNTWGQRYIHVPEAWDYQTGSDNIIVAVLDSGVQLDHPDFAGRLNSDGWDFINNDSDPTDDYGHGTEMAGIIASVRNNGIGYAGVSQSKILPIKVLNDTGKGKPKNLSNGIDYAVSHNAKIISMSLLSNTTDDLVNRSIVNAYNAGCLLVAAGGNYASNQVVYPAGYDNVIGVSAIGSDGQLAWFSNSGSHIDFAAPGVDIGTTSMGSTYTTSTGTSPATAMVSGVAALVWSQNPTTIRDRIITYMINPAFDFGDLGRDDRYGYGVINAYGTVTYGIMLVGGTGTIWVPNTGVQCYFDVPAPSIIDTIMVGNENADFNIYLRWNYPPTPTSYDAASLSGYSLERAITTGAGRLYIVVYSNSGVGNFKLCSISGAPTDGNFVANTLQQGYGYYTGGQGWGKGYAFNSGPDTCNFDLAIKWNQIATPTVYDAKSETFAAQEIVGPVYGTGDFYSTVYSQGGSGEFAMLRFVY